MFPNMNVYVCDFEISDIRMNDIIWSGNEYIQNCGFKAFLFFLIKYM